MFHSVASRMCARLHLSCGFAYVRLSCLKRQ